MNKLRRSYEARVLLVPLGDHASSLAAEMADAGLEGVVTLTASRVTNERLYTVAPLATETWSPPGEYYSLDVVAAADMAVLLVGDLREVDADLCRRVARTAEAAGTLIAALVVGQQHGDDPGDNSAMAILRDAVDMLVVVRGLRLATPFIDVLRGGAREPALAG